MKFILHSLGSIPFRDPPLEFFSKNVDLSLWGKQCSFPKLHLFFRVYPSSVLWNENATHNLLLNKIFNFELKKCCYFNSRYTIHEYYIKYVGDYFFISKKILFIRKICKYMFLYYYSFQAKHLKCCSIFYWCCAGQNKFKVIINVKEIHKR